MLLAVILDNGKGCGKLEIKICHVVNNLFFYQFIQSEESSSLCSHKIYVFAFMINFSNDCSFSCRR